MVIGIVASNALLYPTTSFLNEAFLLQFRSLQANSVTGLFSLAGYFLIYCIAITASYMLLFSLPQALPDNILRWIGAGIGDLGEKGMAGKMEGQASAQARQAAVWGSSKAAGLQEARRQRQGASLRDGTSRDAAINSVEAGNAIVGETGQSSIPADIR